MPNGRTGAEAHQTKLLEFFFGSRDPKRLTEQISTTMLPTADAPHAARLRLHRLDTADARAAFARDTSHGLTASPKQLFPKYFYDELGS
ncbi:MAG TPA: hypothetical protein VIQ24_00995, partial [Pyrinomonadaceae bacterium]